MSGIYKEWSKLEFWPVVSSGAVTLTLTNPNNSSDQPVTVADGDYVLTSVSRASYPTVEIRVRNVSGATSTVVFSALSSTPWAQAPSGSPTYSTKDEDVPEDEDDERAIGIVIDIETATATLRRTQVVIIKHSPS